MKLNHSYMIPDSYRDFVEAYAIKFHDADVISNPTKFNFLTYFLSFYLVLLI